MRKQDGILIRIDTPQGPRVVGKLVNNVLHIDRDYGTHHLHKYKGWAMATEVFEQHPEVRGIRINAKNAPMKGGAKGDRIYLFSFDEANLEPSDMETKNFGYGEQVFIPDNLWEVLDTNGFLRSEKPEPEKEPFVFNKPLESEIHSGPPFAPQDFDVIFYPESDKETMTETTMTATTMTSGKIGGGDYTHPVSHASKAPYRAFDATTAITLVDAGYKLHLFEMQEGLTLSKNGHNYVLNIPGVSMDIHVDIEAFFEQMKGKRHSLDF